EMPRIFISVFTFQRAVAFGRNVLPSRRFVPLRTLGEERECRHDNEVLNSENHRSEYGCDRACHSKVCLPQTTETRAPQLPSMSLGRHSDQLTQCVVHVKDLVMQDLFEYRTRRGIPLQRVAI